MIWKMKSKCQNTNYHIIFSYLLLILNEITRLIIPTIPMIPPGEGEQDSLFARLNGRPKDPVGLGIVGHADRTVQLIQMTSHRNEAGTAAKVGRFNSANLKKTKGNCQSQYKRCFNKYCFV